MNKETLEHISSLMDGELSRETSLFLTRRLSTDEELIGTWERYHLIRDCIRQPGSGTPVVNLSQRMRDALSEESAVPQSVWESKRWLKPVSGLAIAATVAMMAIVAVDPGTLPQDPNATAGSELQPFSSPNVLPTSPNSQAASFTPENNSDARLNSYLVRHNQLVGSVSSQGFLSFVPIVSSPGEEPVVDEENAEQQVASDGNEAIPEQN
jgi:sigma-E factor negative regulatory protein RseA